MLRSGTPVTGSDLDGLLAAQSALDLTLQEPSEALRVADRLLASRCGPHAASIAHRAAGLALADVGDLPHAERRLREATKIAEQHGLDRPAAQARMSLAVVLGARGDLAGALRELDRAEATLRGNDRAEVVAQRAHVFGTAERYEESMAAYGRALPVLRRSGNVRFEALALLNRSVFRSLHGDLRGAEADLRRCIDVARGAGLSQVLADAENNLGYLAACRGEIPAALAAFARAEAVPGVGAVPLATTWLDRATTLLRVGLPGDAAADAARAAALLDRVGHRHDAAAARLLLAESLLARGDTADAVRLADATAAELRRRRRPLAAARAIHTAIRARHANGERGAPLLHDARRNAEQLERLAGPARNSSVSDRPERAAATAPFGARPALLLLARILIEQGRTAEAARVLARCTDRRSATRERVAVYNVRALMHSRDGDVAAARRAVRSGLRLVHEYAAALGTGELRAAAFADGRELAALGTSLALKTRRPTDVLMAAETQRARSLDRPPTRPPADAALAAALANLRRVELEAADLDNAEPARLGAERARLERAVRDRSRSGPGGDASQPNAGWSGQADQLLRLDRGGIAADVFERLTAALGPRGLVVYLRCGDDLSAVTIHDGLARLHSLGRWEPIVGEMAALRFAAHRLWRSPAVPATGRATRSADDALAAVRAALDRAACLLDDALLAPLGLPADRALVLLPTAELHAIPFGLLPSLRGRPVQLIPSLTWWLNAAPRSADRGTGRVVLAAGPGLRHATREVRGLAALRPGATVLTGRHATVDAVLAAMDGAAIAHLACHGRFRADHPDFSSLEFVDGALTVYDLHRLRRPPRLLVLTACEAARTAARPGEQLLGLAAGVLGLGTQTLIAPVTAVPDRDARRLAVALHARLATGAPPAVALAAAAADTGVSGFVCLGGR
ncbi:MAG: CHAT domain-containing protein [Sporichthyaceae bacterium]